ncbi:Secretory component protein SHR3 [Wickerhamiella sorbophila]|uniref:Secretory component protein SHR3 n=1 Tax=Wickerhamiella sorbophila TaxID=45607 RepID=A0A2T0FJ48_9ASCO|nr:Secretory component protein SHR3 [Wickerhamiella sorbophila]PRT55018.1 Secretory component protein SHR3 [Wickerhamiella sorbophila]
MASSLDYMKSLGTGLIILATGFVLGSIYANWAYDYYMLWKSPVSPEMVSLTAQHYRMRAGQPAFLHHVLHGVLAIGFTGIFIKIYKPTEANTLFDGGSLVLFVIAIVFYLSNLRVAAQSVLTGDWYDIDETTGIQLMSASQVLIVLVFMGVLALQLGQWWAAKDTASQIAKAKREQTQAQSAATSEADTEPSEAEPVKVTGSSKSKANKRK